MPNKYFCDILEQLLGKNLLNKIQSKAENFYFWRRGIMKVNNEVCIGCGTCIDSCPVAAISMVDGKAEINQDICIHCGTCTGVCPVNAIEE